MNSVAGARTMHQIHATEEMIAHLPSLQEDFQLVAQDGEVLGFFVVDASKRKDLYEKVCGAVSAKEVEASRREGGDHKLSDILRELGAE